MTLKSYRYRAVTRRGEKLEGIISASDDREAARTLLRDGLIPINLETQDEETKNSLGVPLLKRRIKRSDCIQLFDELATLLAAGIPLGEALPSLVSAYREQALGLTLEAIDKEVRSGNQFSMSLRQANLPIPPYVLALVDAGDASGRLSAALADSSTQMKHEAEIGQELRNALIYPVILVISGIIAVLVVFIAVVPRFASLLKSGRAELPDISRMVLTAGLYAQENLLILAILVIMLAALLIFIFSQEHWRSQALEFLARIPLTRGWILPTEVGRWATLLATLLDNHVVLIDAIVLSRELFRLPSLKSQIDRALKDIRHGQALSQAFAEQGWLGPTQVNLISVGERSGELARMLRSLGNQQTSLARLRIKRLLALIEPLAILLIGAAIGFIMVAVMMAITSLNTARL